MEEEDYWLAKPASSKQKHGILKRYILLRKYNGYGWVYGPVAHVVNSITRLGPGLLTGGSIGEARSPFINLRNIQVSLINKFLKL